MGPICRYAAHHYSLMTRKMPVLLKTLSFDVWEASPFQQMYAYIFMSFKSYVAMYCLQKYFAIKLHLFTATKVPLIFFRRTGPKLTIT